MASTLYRRLVYYPSGLFGDRLFNDTKEHPQGSVANFQIGPVRSGRLGLIHAAIK
jgi:hypothetical protein